MSAKKWKFYYKKNEYPFLSESIVDTIILWVTIGLFWLSFFDVIKNIHASFTESSDTSYIVVIMWLFLLWLFYEVIAPRVGERKKAIKWLVPVGNILIFLGYYQLNSDTLFTGALAIIDTYLKDYNAYYNANYSVGGGDYSNRATTFLFVVNVVWFVLWNLAYILKKKWILMAFPLLSIGLALSVGVSPSETGVYLFFIGALLMVTCGVKEKAYEVVHATNAQKEQFLWQRMFAKGIIVCLLLLSLLLSNVVYKNEMSGMVARKQELLDFQKELFSKEFSFDILSYLDVQFDKEVLTNEAPVYTGAHVLTVTTSHVPYGHMYLKGYIGNVYKDSVWTGDYSSFNEACRKNDESKEDVAADLLNRAFDTLPIYMMCEAMEFSVVNEKSVGNVAYVPYFTMYDSLDDDYSLNGDFVVEKRISDGEVRGICFNFEGPNNSATLGFDYLMMAWNNDSEFSWYDELAKKEYTKIPEEFERLFNDMQLERIAEGADDRLKIAKAVRNYFYENMTYSLELDELPAGTDPVEYLLTTSNEGYCMHFASAGTLMLRYLGVPARYVSGYVVQRNLFNSSWGEYVAKVTDYNAHAWVEIYIEQLGWIPIEMTPGYERYVSELPTQQNRVPESEEPPSESVESESEELPSESEEIPSESEEVTSEGEKEEFNPLPKESEVTIGEGNDSSKGDSDAGTGIRIALKGLFAVLIATVLGCIIYAGYKHWCLHYNLIIETAVKKKHTRRAVKKMHRRLYGYIRIRKLRLKGMRDKEFEALLIENFKEVPKDDWRYYMEIAKKMHFSEEDISEDEMLHCYWCYMAASEEFFKKEEC